VSVPRRRSARTQIETCNLRTDDGENATYVTLSHNPQVREDKVSMTSTYPKVSGRGLLSAYS
jgi:hypothetical protein